LSACSLADLGLQRGDEIIVFKCLLIGQRQGLSQRFGKWHTVYDCATL